MTIMLYFLMKRSRAEEAELTEHVAAAAPVKKGSK
jgi:hypothetical protein